MFRRGVGSCWCAIERPPHSNLCRWAPFLERGIFTHLFTCLFVLDSSLACAVLYTFANVYGCLFRTRNIHILHSPVYLCLPLGCLGGFVMFVGAYLERGVFTHLFRLVLDSSLACVVLYICANVSGCLFLEREIFTHFIRLLSCV